MGQGAHAETCDLPRRNAHQTWTMRTLALVASILLVGCIDLSGNSSKIEGDDDGGGGDSDECKIEGSQIGSDGVVVRLGPKSVTFHDWVTKDGSPGEYMGFSLTVGGADSVGYVVKAGTERFSSRTTTWSGEGLTMHAISNVDMCEECTDGSCDGGDGGDDGCIEGCDDGGGDGSGSGSGSGDGSGSDGPLT